MREITCVWNLLVVFIVFFGCTVVPSLKIFETNGGSDFDGRDLFSELRVLQEVLPKETKEPIELLNFLKLMDGCLLVEYFLTIQLQLTWGT